MERRIWNPSPDRWILIDRDGALIDIHRTESGRLSFHGGDCDPRELESWMRAHGHLTP